MRIISWIYCLFEGHAFIDVTATERPYQFCLRCGKIKEPTAVLVRSHVYPKDQIAVRVRVDR